MKTKAMTETNVAEAEVEAVDEVKAQHKVVEEAIWTRGMTNLNFNAIIVRSLDIMLQNIELPAIE